MSIKVMHDSLARALARVVLCTTLVFTMSRRNPWAVAS